MHLAVLAALFTNDMDQLLARIAEGLRRGAYPNERAVSTSIVVPVLRCLGWDDIDPTVVRPEYATGSGRVDYALFPHERAPAVFVEVKGVGKSGDADRQLFEYAFHEGAQIAVLTDGRVWNFYLPGEYGNYEDRRVYQLDILERSAQEAALRFDRYLLRERVTNGAALEDARSDYRNQANSRLAEAVMPQAWSDMLREPDVELVNLIRDRTEAMSGHRPSDSAIERFLLSAVPGGMPDKAVTSVKQPRRTAPSPTPVAQSLTEGLRTIDDVPARVVARFAWRLGPQSGEARNQVEAWVQLLAALFEAYPDRRAQMAAAVRTRSRNNIAQSVDEVYPGKPDIARKSHEKLPGGWYVGTNESSGTKMRIAMNAAGACGLAWGRDVELRF